MDKIFLVFLFTIIILEGANFMQTNQSNEISENIVRKVNKIKEKISTVFSLVCAFALFLGMSILSYKVINFFGMQLNIQITNSKMVMCVFLSFVLAIAFMFLIFYEFEKERYNKKRCTIFLILMLISSANTSFAIMYFIGNFCINL